MASGSTSSMGIGSLGQVVEQVVQQDLDRQHRQEGQNEGGSRHREHVPEVRARPHHHVFHDIAEGAPAFAHAALQHREIGLEQDDVGRILGDIHRRIDGDADIGGMQRRRVVDAVAQKPTTWPRRFRARMMRFFWAGVTRQKRLISSIRALRRLLAERRELGAGEDAGDRECPARRRGDGSPARCRRSGS